MVYFLDEEAVQSAAEHYGWDSSTGYSQPQFGADDRAAKHKVAKPTLSRISRQLIEWWNQSSAEIRNLSVPAPECLQPETRQIYSLKPVLLRPDRQQARLNFRVALPIGNAVSNPGCGFEEARAGNTSLPTPGGSQIAGLPSEPLPSRALQWIRQEGQVLK